MDCRLTDFFGKRSFTIFLSGWLSTWCCDSKIPGEKYQFWKQSGHFCNQDGVIIELYLWKCITLKLFFMKCSVFYKCLAFMLFPMVMYGKADFSVFNLTCEQAKNPLGIETQQPRFSWQIRSSERNFVQSSYEVLVADSPEKIGRASCRERV